MHLVSNSLFTTQSGIQCGCTLSEPLRLPPIAIVRPRKSRHPSACGYLSLSLGQFYVSPLPFYTQSHDLPIHAMKTLFFSLVFTLFFAFIGEGEELYLFEERGVE